MSIYRYDAAVDSKASIDYHQAQLSPIINNLIYLKMMKDSADPARILFLCPRKACILRM